MRKTGEYKIKIAKTNNYVFQNIQRKYNKGRENKVSVKDFRTVLNAMGEILAERLLTTSEVTLPFYLGSLYIGKYNIDTYYKNGKLKTTRLINWVETQKLWKEDTEAKKNKYVIHNEGNTMYRLMYSKKGAKYSNGEFFHFRFLKSFKKEFSHRAMRGEIEGFLIQ